MTDADELRRYRLVKLSPLFESPPRETDGAMLCPRCAGTGRKRRHKRRPCAICRGLGVVMVEDTP